MDDAFEYLLRVRYSECDAQLVVFNARYVEYIDVAVTEFQRHMWGSYQELLNSGLDNQLVNMNIDWKVPARFDDVLRVVVKTSRVGNSSFVLRVDFYRLEDDEHLSGADITYVMVSTPDYRPAPIDDAARAKLLAGLPGVRVDHAGVG